MDIKDLVSVEEAAAILGYRKSSITPLCRKGLLEGAFKIGHQWFIPRKVVENYEKAPQGFAAIWKRRHEAEKAEEAAMLETASDRVEEEENVESLEREILHYMRILARKFQRLEKMMAQDKEKH